jgi:hypothetical protein
MLKNIRIKKPFGRVMLLAKEIPWQEVNAKLIDVLNLLPIVFMT